MFKHPLPMNMPFHIFPKALVAYLSLLIPLNIYAAKSNSTSSEQTIAASAPFISYTGRVLIKNETTTLSFPGTEIRIRFEGTSLAFKGQVLGGDAWFNLQIDGKPKPRIDLPQGSFTKIIAEDLDPKTSHEIRIVRRNEAWQGTIRLDQFIVSADGKFLEGPEARERKILCLGDSITCGQGTEFYPPYSVAGNSNANAELSFGWQLAKHFDADVNLASYGGRGIVRDYLGNTESMHADEIFERTHSDSPEPRWDHSQYTPDLITICFGTNDYATGFVDRDPYFLAYKNLIERVHSVHPDAKILLLSSPMLPGYAPDKAKHLYQILVDLKENFTKNGFQFLEVYELGDYAGTEWDAHPTGKQHTAITEELIPIISKWLNWK